MNERFRNFLHRGLIFGGFGPIVTGIVFFIISCFIDDFSISGIDAFTAIISTYILAFVHAGASVLNQIEEWPMSKSLFYHLGILYVTYIVCYLINSWIPFEPIVILIFTGIFLAVYFVVWTVVVISIKAVEKRLNKVIK